MQIFFYITVLRIYPMRVHLLAQLLHISSTHQELTHVTRLEKIEHRKWRKIILLSSYEEKALTFLRIFLSGQKTHWSSWSLQSSNMFRLTASCLYYRFLQQSHFALKRNHCHTATLLVQTIFQECPSLCQQGILRWSHDHLVTNEHVRKEILIVFCHNFNTRTHGNSVIWLKVGI